MKISIKDLRNKVPVRLKPWMVIYYENRIPRRKFYATKEEAEAMAKDLRIVVQTGATPKMFAEAARLSAGTGYTIPQLVSLGVEFIRSNKAEKASPTSTFAEGVQLYLKQAIEDSCRPTTIAGYTAAFAVLNRTFGGRIAATITETEVREYMRNLRSIKKVVGQASPYTTRSALRHIKAALLKLGIEKPLAGIKKPGIGDKEIEFFTVEQVRRLFECARPSERGGLAMLLYGALRPTLIERLTPACISVERKTLRIPHFIAKDRHTHILETEGKHHSGHWMSGLPRILWKWLEKYPFQPVKWVPFQKRLRKALEGKWIHDGTRHTGATYIAALYGDKAASILLTHESPMIATKHYIGVAYRDDAIAFYKLNPKEFGETYQFKNMRKVINWPTDSELAELLKIKPASAIAKSLKCSGVALAKRCKRRNIPKPGRGYWAKRQHGCVTGL